MSDRPPHEKTPSAWRAGRGDDLTSNHRPRPRRSHNESGGTFVDATWCNIRADLRRRRIIGPWRTRDEISCLIDAGRFADALVLARVADEAER